MTRKGKSFEMQEDSGEKSESNRWDVKPNGQRLRARASSISIRIIKMIDFDLPITLARTTSANQIDRAICSLFVYRGFASPDKALIFLAREFTLYFLNLSVF